MMFKSGHDNINQFRSNSPILMLSRIFAIYFVIAIIEVNGKIDTK